METFVANDKVVAFIDILGFSALVTRTLSGDDATLTRVYEKLRMLSGLAKLTNDPYITPHARATAFSDCIVISDTNSDLGIMNVLSIVAMIAGILLQDEILCRGGIATGRTIHDERVLLSEGLIAAYEIEQHVAVYPRIVVHDELVKKVKAFDCLIAFFSPPLKRDADGFWFIDLFSRLYRFKDGPESVFTSWLPEREFDIDQFQKVRAFISRSLCDMRSDLSRLMKYRWLANRFNEAVLEYVPGQIEALEV